MTPLDFLVSQSTTGLVQFGIAFLRIGTMVSVLPGFGEQSVPVRIKLGIAIAFSLAVSAAAPTFTPPEEIAALWSFGLAEITCGFVLGIGLRIALFALQTAGTIAAQATSLAQLLGNAAADPMPAIGHVLTLAGLTYLMSTGFHVSVVRYVLSSYDVLPAGRWPVPENLQTWSVMRVSRSFAQAFQLAAPFYLVSLLYNLALGAINRAMPQLMVAFIGAPFLTWAALALLLLAAMPITLVWSGFMAEAMTSIGGRTP